MNKSWSHRSIFRVNNTTANLQVAIFAPQPHKFRNRHEEFCPTQGVIIVLEFAVALFQFRWHAVIVLRFNQLLYRITVVRKFDGHEIGLLSWLVDQCREEGDLPTFWENYCRGNEHLRVSNYIPGKTEELGFHVSPKKFILLGKRVGSFAVLAYRRIWPDPFRGILTCFQRPKK